MTDLTPRTVLFSDVAGSMKLYGELGAEAALQLIWSSLAICESEIHRQGGLALKNTGDGWLAVFETPADAINAALSIQESHRTNSKVQVKIGLCAGDVMLRDNDAFGDPVNLAARICDKASGGMILASWSVVSCAPGDVVVVDQGALRLKNHPEPVLVYRVETSRGGGTIIDRTSPGGALVGAHKRARLSLGSPLSHLDIGADYPLVSVGRESRDVVVPRSGVSRAHGTFRWSAADGFVYTDASTNGTFIRQGTAPVKMIHHDRIVLETSTAFWFGNPHPEEQDLFFEFLAD